jgi:hypothetical protein
MGNPTDLKLNDFKVATARPVQQLATALLEVAQLLEQNKPEYLELDIRFLTKLSKIIVTDPSKKKDPLLIALKAELYCWYFANRFPSLTLSVKQRVEKDYTELLAIIAILRFRGPIFGPRNESATRLFAIAKAKTQKKQQIASKMHWQLTGVQARAIDILFGDRNAVEMASSQLQEQSQAQLQSTVVLETKLLAALVYISSQTNLTQKEWVQFKLKTNYPMTIIGQFEKLNSILTFYYYLRLRTPLSKQFETTFQELADYLVKMIQEIDVIASPALFSVFDSEEKRRKQLIPGYAKLAK